MLLINRRKAIGLLTSLPFVKTALAEDQIETLTVASRILDVKGKAAKVFGITNSAGKPGLNMVFGTPFRARVINSLNEATSIHWHGLTPPVELDGVPDLPVAALKAGEAKLYEFPNNKAGTHWMHSHLGLQEQRLLAAPLIIRETETPLFDEQEHVVMIHDFSFRDPAEILAELKTSGSHQMAGMTMGSDIAYDAILTNDRTLDDPEIVQVENGGQIRLRIINGSAANNFWIDLGVLKGELFAVDGNTVKPVMGSRFPLAIAQRADIRLKLPQGAGAYPIVFQAEGDTIRGGLFLRNGNGVVAKLSDQGEAGDALDFSLEAKLNSVVKGSGEPASNHQTVILTGGDNNYEWGFNHKSSMMHDVLFNVRQGERVQIIMQNITAMAHPMHLHGHYFKVVALGALRVDGAVRDTILVPAGESVTIEFDADNPGTWAFHCHHLYHMNSGMMAAMAYVSAA
jgi:FtsP/CotA-like multicopper oxidase with cupredoxin domain